MINLVFIYMKKYFAHVVAGQFCWNLNFRLGLFSFNFLRITKVYFVLTSLIAFEKYFACLIVPVR